LVSFFPEQITLSRHSLGLRYSEQKSSAQDRFLKRSQQTVSQQTVSLRNVSPEALALTSPPDMAVASARGLPGGRSWLRSIRADGVCFAQGVEVL